MARSNPETVAMLDKQNVMIENSRKVIWNKTLELSTILENLIEASTDKKTKDQLEEALWLTRYIKQYNG